MEQVLAERPVREQLLDRLAAKSARIGVVGLGYVGLPLAITFARNGFRTVGIDADERKIRALNAGESYVGDVLSGDVADMLAARRFRAGTDPSLLCECDCIAVCVPTPLNKTNDPDLSYIEHATAALRRTLRRGQLIVFESTTYPGCTEELVLPELLRAGLVLDEDFLLAFSPERVDPGNDGYHTANIPRIVGGCSADSCDVAAALYSQIVDSVHLVSSARVAETAKLLENTFRAVNIGLANEIAMMCRQMNLDVWEVIEAAKTKPYGFMAFYPGPGIGGHCIPLDPAYLDWRGRQFGFESRFINLAEHVNAEMPLHTVELVTDALNEDGKPLKDARILVLGAAYKKDVADVRESPAIEIIQALRAKRAAVHFHDPLVDRIDFSKMQSRLRREMMFTGPNRRRPLSLRYEGSRGERVRRLGDTLHSVPLNEDVLAMTDCVVIVTDHSGVDYEKVVRHAPLVVDTRNVIGPRLRAMAGGRIVRL